MKLQLKNFFSLMVALAVLTSSLGLYAGAVDTGKTDPNRFIPARASGRFSLDVPANTLAKTSRSFSLESGETITINASYSPSSASVDFGVIAPNGLFYSVGGSDGSINDTFEADERGSYTLAIRNNSSWTVSVSGYVNY